MKSTLFAVVFGALIASFPACAGSINGMQQSAVCDPFVNQGQYCVKPNPDGSMPVSEVSGSASAYGGGAITSVTRPTNTTTYTANTAWANATSGATYLTFTSVCRANGTFVLPTDLLVTDNANQTLKLTGVLWLLDAAPTAINDNATFSITSGDLAKIKTFIPFTTATVVNQASGASGSMIDEEASLGRALKCASNDSNLYGLVQVTNAYVPISGEILTFTLRVIGVN